MSQTNVYIWAVYKLHRSEGKVNYEQQRKAGGIAVIDQQILNSLRLLWALAKQESWIGLF